jgi:mycofactocin precursor
VDSATRTDPADDPVQDGTATGAQDAPAEPGLAETLIEEVSIDGMCGVY